MPTPNSIEEVVRELANRVATQLKPSNDTMEAVRLFTKEITALLTSRTQAEDVLERLEKEIENATELHEVGKSEGGKSIMGIGKKSLFRKEEILSLLQKSKAEIKKEI